MTVSERLRCAALMFTNMNTGFELREAALAGANELERITKQRDDLMNQCRDHDTRRAAAVTQASALAAEVERLNVIISHLSVEGQDAVEHLT